MMGGKIWVESEYGKGTTMHFTAMLGIHREGRGLATRKLAEVSQLRILVVDDNQTARDILTGMIASFGARVEQANNGLQALEMVSKADRGDPYSLVMIDWKMPFLDGVQTCQKMQQELPLSHQPDVILITAYGRDDAQQAARDIRVAGFLTKPATSSGLLDVIVTALGRGVVAAEGRREERQEEAAQAVAKLRDARVLLVEDNEINQELALELLSSNGMQPTLVENGQQALDILDKQQFDIVLMDCQMPVMDGYTATRKIREQARFRDLPVLAMTANAMAGDREKALAAGMNDHIAKPINLDALLITMAKWCGSIQAAEAEVAPPVKKLSVESSDAILPHLPGIDAKAGLKIAMGDIDFYKELLVRSCKNFSNFDSVMSAALQHEDNEEATRRAHSLKGVAATIGAREVEAAAAELERACNQKQDPEQIAKHHAVVLKALETVMNGLLPLMHADEKPAARADPDMLKDVLSQLLKLLEQDDIAAQQMLGELRPYSADAVRGEAVHGIVEAVRDFEFSRAISLIQAMLQDF
jgi:CheY-like chemotaxis protein